MDKIRELVLKKLKFMNRIAFSKLFLENISIEEYQNILSEEIVHNISWWVLGREINKSIVERHKYPSTLWDMFKEKYFSNYLKRHFPIKYTYIDTTIHHFHVCPHINISFKECPDVHLNYLFGDE